MTVDRNDEKRWSTNDIFDAWNALFPESDQHDVALLAARLDEQGGKGVTSVNLIDGHVIQNGAEMSAEGWYRYNLWRSWEEPGCRRVCWVMLNPSTADAELDDPTIRRCIAFSRAWGFGELEVVNLFALRSTDPKALTRHPDPVGPDNHEAITTAIRRSDLVVAAWGSFKIKHSRPSIDTYCHNLGRPLRCLGKTKDGSPRHPLYVAASTELEPFGLYESDQ